ncbi:MAG: MerR family transcriptional regulator [Stappiaceae bacterium]
MSNVNRISYELRDVIEVTGFSKQVLHAWERRYGVVRPRRGEDGSRLYSDADLHRLQLLRKCVDSGHRIGQLALLDDGELKRTAIDGVPNTEISVDDILAAVRVVDTATIENRLSVQFAALGPIRFAKFVAMPVLAAVGSMWELGSASIEAEHFVTSVVRTFLGSGLQFTQNRDVQALAVFTTPEGELHELGALTAALFAQSAGLRAVFLGSQLPPNALVRAATTLGASVVCLSSSVLSRERLALYVTEISDTLPMNVELWLGGNAFAALRNDLPERVFFFEDFSDYLDAVPRFRVRATRA